MPRKRAPQKNFDVLFCEALEKIVDDARELGVPLIDLSEEVGISRAQFSRWRTRAPATIQAMARLQAALEARRRRPRGGGG
jgi:hypothetical protein